MLAFAAKLGQADVVSCILEQETPVLDITAAARLAIVEGHTDCLERLLRAGPSLFPFLSAYAPGTNISARHLCVILDAVHLNDEAALDLLRTRGVRWARLPALRMTTNRSIGRVDSATPRPRAQSYAIPPSSSTLWGASLTLSRGVVIWSRGDAQGTRERAYFAHAFELYSRHIHGLDSAPACSVSKDLKTVELVLEQGVDVNECHAGKKSALAIAAQP